MILSVYQFTASIISIEQDLECRLRASVLWAFSFVESAKLQYLINKKNSLFYCRVHRFSQTEQQRSESEERSETGECESIKLKVPCVCLWFLI